MSKIALERAEFHRFGQNLAKFGQNVGKPLISSVLRVKNGAKPLVLSLLLNGRKSGFSKKIPKKPSENP